jgi:hypothetical protein
VERVAQIGRVQLHMLKAHSYHGVSTYRKPLFPKALGFLYYDPGPVFAPIAGEVRFRIVPSGLPGDFEHGLGAFLWRAFCVTRHIDRLQP